MPSKALFTLYTILIVLLVLTLFLVVLALIVFRESFESCCCPGRTDQPLVTDDRRRRRSLSGQLNPTFDEEQNRPRRFPEQRPFNPMEAVETPPTYEEAVKQELFRFRPTTAPHSGRSDLPTEASNSSQDINPSVNPSGDGAFASGVYSQPVQDWNMPSTSSAGSTQSSRRRAPTISAITTQLSTISEEDSEAWPVTVVIDSIGVQAARLLENCETTISLESGNELGTHSKC